MGDTIEFPLNDEMYFKQASEFVENQEYEKALAAIEKVYENNKNPMVSYLYSVILYSLDRYDEALEIVDVHKEFYLSNEKYAISYVMLLIKNFLFLEAEAIIQQYLADSSSPYNSVWESLETELDTERERLNIEIEKKRKETKKKLLELENYSPFNQSEIINEAHHLELLDLQEVAPFIFSSPYLSGTTQRAFLEVLVDKQDDTEYSFPWFNQLKKVVPKNLDLFEQMPVIDEIQKVLDEKVYKHPSLYDLMYIEILNDLLLLYPFVEETITDVDYWVECYIEQLDYTKAIETNTDPKNEEQIELKKWLDHLNQISQRNGLR